MISHKHLITTLFVFLLYLFGAWVGQQIQSRPIYAGHLAFQRNFGNDYDYNDPRHKNYDGKNLEEFKYCRDVYLPSQWARENEGDDFYVLSWSRKLWITLGTGFGALVVTHLILAVITQIRWSGNAKKEGLLSKQVEQ